jgi:salicylate hydroxylase
VGERQTIVVAGAGIAGLTAALSIAAAGLGVVVCERARQLSEIGAGIQLTPNPLRVLAALGLEAAVAAASVEPLSIDVRSGRSGSLIASLDASLFRSRYGTPYRVIHRADLQSILAAAVAATSGIELRLGVTVTGTGPRPGGIGVQVEHPRGRETIPAAGLIAADGVRSALRLSLGGSPARATGRAAWRAMLPAAGAPPALAAAHVGLWLGPDAHLVHYPVSGGRSINLVAIVEEHFAGEGWSEPADSYQLASYFSHWSRELQAIVAAPSEWRRFAMATVDASASWARDRVALVGDAAHAMSPYLAQGAAMAIEDAWVMGRRLAALPDVPAAFAAWEAERRPRVVAVAAQAERTGLTYHFGALAGLARDMALRIAPVQAVLGRNDWIYRWTPEP